MKTRTLLLVKALGPLLVALLTVLFLSAFGGCGGIEHAEWQTVGVCLWLLAWFGVVFLCGRWRR